MVMGDTTIVATAATEQTVHLHVTGMMCQMNCASTVKNALQGLPGYMHADVSYAEQYASVTCCSMTDTLEDDAKNVIECVGFDATVLKERPITIHFKVTGMMCQKSCATTVENALNALPGVVQATASFAQSYASVTVHTLSDYRHCLEQFQNDAKEAIECVGFDASIMQSHQELAEHLQKHTTWSSSTTTSEETLDDDLDETSIITEATGIIVFHVGGMSCAICVGRVEGLLSQVPGVVGASVMLTTHRAQVKVLDSHHDTVTSVEAIATMCCNAVINGGYDCSILQLGGGAHSSSSLGQNAAQLEESRKAELHMWQRLFLISCALTIPLVILHHHTFPILMNTKTTPPLQEWLMLILATPVQFGVGARYYKAAYKGWTNGRFLGMDFLVVMGTTASYLYSIVIFGSQCLGNVTATMSPTFATGAMLFTFVTLGKFMEAYAKGKTASALQMLMELQPHAALKVVGIVGDLDSSVDLTSLETVDVSAADVRAGDYLYVLPGSRIPADGILIATSDGSMSAYVDESALSGEPFPIAKRINEPLFGATVNQLSTLLVRVTASGNATVLAKIVQLMEQAQSQKAPIQAQADKIACVFAPTVLFLSVLTFIGWLVFNHGENRFFLAIMSSISVIVVACPCALGLATPTAVMVGTGVGATHGLLIKGGAVLEGAHGINTVVLDKTGTLTTGKAVLKHVKDLISPNDDILRYLPSNVPREHVALWLAACAEKQSEHPLAKAIVNGAKALWGGDVTCSHDSVEVSDFYVSIGSGVECLIRKPYWGEWRVRVGNRSWVNESLLTSNEIITESVGDADIQDMRQSGKVGVYVSILPEKQYLERVDCSGKPHCRRVIGVLGIADPIEQEAKTTVLALQKMGIDVWMCTGDDEVTALAVANQVGIDEANVCAGVKPEGKADLVTRLQKRRSVNNRSKHKHQNGRVAMVGDGINDAIALARADVGIALGAGTEVAVEAADMVLVRSSLHDVVVALHLSRVVFRRIRINFVWAMGYNLLALPVAAGALYPFLSWRLPPEFAGLMMAFSSVSVVTSSLLLRTYTKPIILEDGSFARPRCFGKLIDKYQARCDSWTTKLPVLRLGPLYDDLNMMEDDQMRLDDRYEIV